MIGAKSVGDVFENVPDLLSGHDEFVDGVVERQNGQDILGGDVASLNVRSENMTVSCAFLQSSKKEFSNFS